MKRGGFANAPGWAWHRQRKVCRDLLHIVTGRHRRREMWKKMGTVGKGWWDFGTSVEKGSDDLGRDSSRGAAGEIRRGACGRGAL